VLLAGGLDAVSGLEDVEVVLVGLLAGWTGFDAITGFAITGGLEPEFGLLRLGGLAPDPGFDPDPGFTPRTGLDPEPGFALDGIASGLFGWELAACLGGRLTVDWRGGRLVILMFSNISYRSESSKY